jgi:V/A-type H+-transporting ATPase subunit G/H
VDTETRAYLDAALEGLRQDIRAGTAETAALRQELRGETGALQGETAALRGETVELRQELRAETTSRRQEMRAQAEDLRREMRETAEETRRHFDVVGESIRSDVRAVAEGVAANSEAIERLGTGLRAEMDSRFTGYHAVVRVALQELRRDIHEGGHERGPRSPL